ncbi:hypothetical protein AFK20_01490 [Enhydrobacter aerosaccus]|uniref:Ferrous iron transporter B n=2 Tax=Pseudomonadota TaxID=1224 RepID=A0ABR5IP02_9HYPH|nr:hypothetical protein [Enhydrobacter aerosaccus]KND22803.1 hypothetical protein AFK20_01490 [Enhydrobacter aerosaccus]
MSLPSPNSQKLTATNFDLPSLHLLRPEIAVTLHDAEMHLSEFNDDSSQAPLLLDSVDTLAQLAKVLRLIQLEEGYELANSLSAGLQKLYDERDQANRDKAGNDMIMDVSEGIMTLARYIEFVLLKETIEPSLLLPIINQLHSDLNQPALQLSDLTGHKNSSIAIANPEQNYQPLTSLGIDPKKLVEAYRAGLSVALTAQSNQLSPKERGKLKAMQAACEMVSKRTDSLFWHAADAAVSDLAGVLPLSNLQKRALIFVEQQFNDYLPVNDSRFADLVQFASSRDSQLALQVQHKFSANTLNETQLTAMRRFLFGPDCEATSTLNHIIQQEIDLIKSASDNYARQVNLNSSTDEIDSMAQRLHDLSNVFKTLNLNEVSAALNQQTGKVKTWTQPTPNDFDELLGTLMMAENAAINLAKSHTPGAVILPVYNQTISLHQIETAHNTLVQESRTAIATIETALNNYLNDADKDILHITPVPDMMRAISGACLFLNLPRQSQLLKRAATVLQNLIEQSDCRLSEYQLASIADIVMSADYYLESLETNKPAGNHAMYVGYRSLQHMLVA